MDDQGTNRTSGGVVRLLLALSIIPVGLLGVYLGVIAFIGLRLAIENFNPDMAAFFAIAIVGFAAGVIVTIVVTQIIRRNNVRIAHFRLRDLFVVMTMLAIFLGLMSYVLNKT